MSLVNIVLIFAPRAATPRSQALESLSLSVPELRDPPEVERWSLGLPSAKGEESSDDTVDISQISSPELA